LVRRVLAKDKSEGKGVFAAGAIFVSTPAGPRRRWWPAAGAKRSVLEQKERQARGQRQGLNPAAFGAVGGRRRGFDRNRG